MTRFEEFKEEYSLLLEEIEENRVGAEERKNNFVKRAQENKIVIKSKKNAQQTSIISCETILFSVLITKLYDLGVDIQIPDINKEELNQIVNTSKNIMKSLDQFNFEHGFDLSDIRYFVISDEFKIANLQSIFGAYKEEISQFLSKLYGPSINDLRNQMIELREYIDIILLSKKINSISRDDLEEYYKKLYPFIYYGENYDEKINALKTSLLALGIVPESIQTYNDLLEKKKISEQNASEMRAEYEHAVKIMPDKELKEKLLSALSGKEMEKYTRLVAMLARKNNDPMYIAFCEGKIQSILTQRNARDEELLNLSESQVSKRTELVTRIDKLNDLISNLRNLQPLALEYSEKINHMSSNLSPNAVELFQKNTTTEIGSECSRMNLVIFEIECRIDSFSTFKGLFGLRKKRKLEKEFGKSESQVNKEYNEQLKYYAALKECLKYYTEVVRLNTSFYNFEEARKYVSNIIYYGEFFKENHLNDHAIYELSRGDFYLNRLDLITELASNIPRWIAIFEEEKRQLERQLSKSEEEYSEQTARLKSLKIGNSELGISPETTDEEIIAIQDEYARLASLPDVPDYVVESVMKTSDGNTYSFDAEEEMSDEEFNQIVNNVTLRR